MEDMEEGDTSAEAAAVASSSALAAPVAELRGDEIPQKDAKRDSIRTTLRHLNDSMRVVNKRLQSMQEANSASAEGKGGGVAGETDSASEGKTAFSPRSALGRSMSSEAPDMYGRAEMRPVLRTRARTVQFAEGTNLQSPTTLHPASPKLFGDESGHGALVESKQASGTGLSGLARFKKAVRQVELGNTLVRGPKSTIDADDLRRAREHVEMKKSKKLRSRKSKSFLLRQKSFASKQKEVHKVTLSEHLEAVRGANMFLWFCCLHV